MIRAVIFDRDNTLVRLDDAGYRRLERRLQEISPVLSMQQLEDIWNGWESWPRTIEEEPSFWYEFYGRLASRYGLPADVLAALRTLGPCYDSCFVTFPDVLPCLRALQARAITLAVLTNFVLPSVHLPLQHAGIDPQLFTVCLSSAALGVCKPDPRAYQAAAAALFLSADACAFVDDMPGNVEAACATGMRGILLDRRGIAASAQVAECISDLRGLVDLLEREAAEG